MYSLFIFNFKMRKLLAYIVLVTFLAVFIVASSHELNNKVHEYKIYTKSILRSDKERYGDLYDMSYLSAYKDLNHNKHQIKYPDCTLPKKTDLYVFADSYVWPFFDNEKYYCGVDKLTYWRLGSRSLARVKPDPTKKNILLMEFSERNLRYILDDASFVDEMLKAIQNTLPSEPATTLVNKESLKDKVFKSVFNKNINTNLEGLIWGIPAVSAIKEFKADVNYKLFGSTNYYVTPSKKIRQLYFTYTIDTTENMSSFKPVTKEEIDNIVIQLNRLYDAGKMAGFKNIYLTIVPNPVSVLEPDYNGFTYNKLLERVQQSPDLKITFIDLMNDFARLKQKVYSQTDSHWNWTGAYLWLDKFNDALLKANSDTARKITSSAFPKHRLRSR